MHHDYDAIVIGAGFAGATAARELATRGARTLVLEGRDRTGGRTQRAHFDNGMPVDIGGTFVHWTQPHTWAEIVRYGLTDQVVPASIPFDHIVDTVDGETTWTPVVDGPDHRASAAAKVYGDSRTVFPNPTRPLQALAELEAVEDMTLPDRLAQLDLTPEEREAALGLNFTGGPFEQASYSSMLRWMAAAGHSPQQLFDAIFTYKLACSTGGLLDAILADGGSEVRLSTTVTGVEDLGEGAGVRVTLEGGETLTAAAVVVATPVAIWPHLDFSPALPEKQLAMAKDGMQVFRSGKAMVRIKGESRAISINGDASSPLGGWTDKFLAPDEQVLTLYPDTMLMDAPPTEQQIADWVKVALPHVEVLDARVGSYWEDDPFSYGAWVSLKPGQLTKWAPHEITNHGERISFATSDIATLWNGAFFDGAIETGLRAARDVSASVFGVAGARA